MADLIEKMSLFEIGLNVTVTGVALVFAMLILLVLILALFGKVSVALQKSAEKRSVKAREATLSQMQADNASNNSTVATVINDENDISDEVIAVISAAVSSLYIGSSKKTVIKAIKKANGRRSAWGNAGVVDNTRAF